MLVVAAQMSYNFVTRNETSGSPDYRRLRFLRIFSWEL